VRYDAFEGAVRAAAEHRGLQGGLIPIPELRRTVAAQGLCRRTFDEYVLRMHREGRVHLMTHVEPEKLSEPVRDDCLVYPEGPLLYWIRLV
jgi:hypothetical protein